MIFIIAILVADSVSSSNSSNGKKVAKGEIERIISLSPSITETLFALKLNDKVVGVTRFCNYPPETNGIRKYI